MNNNIDKNKELISAYIDGCVSEEERKQAEDLILNSTEWQEYYKELKRVSSMLQDWSDEDVSPDLTSKIQQSLLNDKLPEEHIMKRKSPFAIGGGAFVTIAICVFIGAVYLKTYSPKAQQRYAQQVENYDRLYLDRQNKQTASRDGVGSDHSISSTAQTVGSKSKINSSVSKVQDEFIGDRYIAGNTSSIEQEQKIARVQESLDQLRSDGDSNYDLAEAYLSSGADIQVESSPESSVVSVAKAQEKKIKADYGNTVAAPSDTRRQRGAGGFQASSYDPAMGQIAGLSGEGADVQSAPKIVFNQRKEVQEIMETTATSKDMALKSERAYSPAPGKSSSKGASNMAGFGAAIRGTQANRESTASVSTYERVARSDKNVSAFKEVFRGGRTIPSQSDYSKNYADEAFVGADRPASAPYEPYHDDSGYGNEERRLEEYDEEIAYYPRRKRRIHRPSVEQYEHVYENPFMTVQNNPLSTFSVDVDTASYSNIRRFLNDGQLPPAKAVRIEEMLNYFTYNYDRPSRGEPFSVNTDAVVSPWNPGHYLVRIGLQGAIPNQKKIPASNLVFLVDVSGSMNYIDKLPLLKKSLKKMVNQLRDDQRVAIVTYSGSARLHLDSTPGAYKARIHAAIDNLRAGGSTAGEAGLSLAYRIAQDNFIRNGNNRVIMATDGDFNVGMSNDHDLVRLIKQKRKSGVFLSILGFGTGNLKDAKMEKIADNGNGTYHYIDSPQEGEKVLVRELGSTLFTIAKDVKIQVEFNPQHIQAYRLIGYENRILAKQDFNNDRVDAGEIGAGHTVTALYEIVPVGVRPIPYQQYKGGVDPLKYQKKRSFFNNPELMTVKLRYKKPNGNRSRLIKRVIHQDKILSRPSGELQFASAVAEFGLILRNSRYKGHASYDHVIQAAQSAIGNDPEGQRREFIRLVETAKRLDHRHYRYDDYPHPQPYTYEEQPVYQPPMQFK